MSDTFAQWRETPIQPGSHSIDDEDASYLAFHVRGPRPCVEIRRASGLYNAATYGAVLEVLYHRDGTNFVILFTYMLVFVRGRNLYPVYAALRDHKAEFIEEFDASRWPEPKDAKAAVIESIVVTVKKDGPPLDEMELSFGQPKNRKLH